MPAAERTRTPLTFPRLVIKASEKPRLRALSSVLSEKAFNGRTATDFVFGAAVAIA